MISGKMIECAMIKAKRKPDYYTNQNKSYAECRRRLLALRIAAYTF